MKPLPLLFLALIVPAALAVGSPWEISYSAQLLDAVGSPYTATNVRLRFFAAAAGGSWRS